MGMPSANQSWMPRRREDEDWDANDDDDDDVGGEGGEKAWVTAADWVGAEGVVDSVAEQPAIQRSWHLSSRVLGPLEALMQRCWAEDPSARPSMGEWHGS